MDKILQKLIKSKFNTGEDEVGRINENFTILELYKYFNELFIDYILENKVAENDEFIFIKIKKV